MPATTEVRGPNLRLLLVCDPSATEGVGARALEVPEGADVAPARNVLHTALAYDVIMVDARSVGEEAVELCSLLSRAAPGASVILIVDVTADPDLYLRAVRTGIEDLVSRMTARRLLARGIDRAQTVAASEAYPVGEMPGAEVDSAFVSVLADLTRTEERLFRALMSRSPEPLQLPELARIGWLGIRTGEHTVHVHLSRLRNKLEKHGLRLRCLRGAGYSVEDARFARNNARATN